MQTQPAPHYSQLPEYAARVAQLEAEGCTTSDAQSVADVEFMQRSQADAEPSAEAQDDAEEIEIADPESYESVARIMEGEMP